MRKHRLPKGEETLPMYEKRLWVFTKPISDKLLIKRVEMRATQGREPRIMRMGYEMSPQEQIAHMKAKDEIGLESLASERLLLEEERRILNASS